MAITPIEGGGASTTLRYLKYDSDKDRLVASRAIETDLNSFYLGEQHKISSGAQNIFFNNLSTSLQWSPLWTGLKDQSIVANQDSTGVINPSARTYGDDVLFVESNGVAVPGVVDAKYTFTAPSNGSYFAAEFIVEEAVVATDWLHYEIFTGTDDTGVMIYMQDGKGVVLDAGAALQFQFDHPLELNTGDQVTIVIYKRTSRNDLSMTYLQVCPGTVSGTEPYRKYAMRPFTDVGVQPKTTQMQRVDTGVWETAQVGVAYVSPEQHGNLYGKVCREYVAYGDVLPGFNFVIPFATVGITTIVGYVLLGKFQSTWFPLPNSDPSSSAWSIQVILGTDGVTVVGGSLADLDSTKGWVDFIM